MMTNKYERYKRSELYKNTRYDADKTQKQMCLDYLEQYETITPLEALTAFGSFRLSALICELRKEGYVITTTINKDELTHSKNAPHYAIYTLIREGEEYDA
jgi:hypothetical protein